MGSDSIKKECPEKTKQKTGFADQLNQQLCELARTLRTCVHEIKKATYLYKGQICNDLQQTADFQTLLQTVRTQMSGEAAKGLDTCQKYLAEAYDCFNGFIDFNRFLKNHCDIVLKVVFGENNDVDISWIDKKERPLCEKGLVGRQKEDGSWDMDNCRWTFEDHLLFAMGSDLYKDSKDLI